TQFFCASFKFIILCFCAFVPDDINSNFFNPDHYMNLMIMSVQSRSDSVDTSLFEKREHIEKLRHTCNLHRKVQSWHPVCCCTQPINSLAFVFDGVNYGASDFAYSAYSLVLVSLAIYLVFQSDLSMLEALVGEASGEEQLFSPKNSLARDRIGSELEYYHEKIKEHYGVSSQATDVGSSPLVRRFQVIDALVSLFCRSNISVETLWDGGWLLRQLLSYSDSEFNSNYRAIVPMI
ncbi:hypothetical protein HN873_023635, partial [Arachis hypogaea]